MKAWCKIDEQGQIVSVYSDPLINEGRAIYNPTEDQLTAAGYVYIDVPEPEPIQQGPTYLEECLASIADRLGHIEEILSHNEGGSDE